MGIPWELLVAGGKAEALCAETIKKRFAGERFRVKPRMGKDNSTDLGKNGLKWKL